VLAALGLIGIIGWVLIMLRELLLAVLIGLLPVGVVLAGSWATARGFREESGRTFWTVTQGVWGVFAVGLIYVWADRRDLIDRLGFSSLDFWFAFAMVAFAMTVAGVRLRRAPKSTWKTR